ncbi:hypothetical protein LOK74_01995 [Brevibacillus humidisoli]|uniref:type II secretion system F family protein n=1 Tax=Brevibacillus humidisoli TaxID=2895522 RepID=UPI001E42682A|nr:hypothetical protein [Brevibacillus humidisoli]UFJ41332.1 hypothetical protein LOK74_01995 [Brevibacillus humidisoli]
MSEIILALCMATLVYLFLLHVVFKKRERIKWIEVQKPKTTPRLKFLEDAEKKGVSLSFRTYVVWWSAAVGSGVTLSLLFSNPLLLALMVGVNFFALKIYVYQKERMIREKAKDQLGPALQNLGSAYRMQRNWKRALETVIPVLQEPLKSEFQRAYQLHNTGVAIGEVFQRMMANLKVPEMQLFVTMAEISEEIGEDAAEGVLVAGAYFQTRRIAMADLANAMMNAVKENRYLMYAFIGVVFFFRFLKPDLFSVYTDNILGKFFLALYMTIALVVPIVSFFIMRKEI